MLTLATEKYESDLLNIDLEVYQDADQNFWFHGATLCDIFELANPSQTIQRHVDEDWRKKFPAVHGKESWFVMEPGFYQLLHSSKHPAAKRFQRWVYSEVLPKLRAEGGYVLPSATAEQLEALQGQIAEQQAQLQASKQRNREIQGKYSDDLRRYNLLHGNLPKAEYSEKQERQDWKNAGSLEQMVDGVLWRKQVGRDSWDVDIETPKYSDYLLWRNTYPDGRSNLNLEQAIKVFKRLKDKEFLEYLSN